MDNELNELSQLQDAIAQEEALITYFYSDNCAPCVSLRPKVKEMIARAYPKMKLYFINSAKYPKMTAEYGIFSNPTLLVYFDKKEYLRKSKYVSIPELEEGISRLYKMMF
ncbi:MAG: thiol reductase thioredoxin [Bacteroidetes bacterium 4572_77]|nr:MAG: thiol reductase thioredoxin [Bacteroidetes bacterium 4572_77]